MMLFVFFIVIKRGIVMWLGKIINCLYKLWGEMEVNRLFFKILIMVWV